MCGIAGILNLKQSNAVTPETLKRMISIQQHRGPDESGVYLDDHIGIAHARLSIIDLTDGTQPIHNEDKTLSAKELYKKFFNKGEVEKKLTFLKNEKKVETFGRKQKK